MFVVSDEEDVDGMQDAGVALVRAYNYICDEVNCQSAFEAVMSVSWTLSHKTNDAYLFLVTLKRECLQSNNSTSLSYFALIL